MSSSLKWMAPFVLSFFSIQGAADTCMYQKNQDTRAGGAIGFACNGYSGYAASNTKIRDVKLSVLDQSGKTFSFEIKEPTENALIFSPENLLLNADVMGWLKENKVDVKSISTIQVESLDIPLDVPMFSDPSMSLAVNRYSGVKAREWNCVYKEPPLVVEAPGCASKVCAGYVQCLKHNSPEVKDYALTCLAKDTACPSANDCADANDAPRPVVATRVMSDGEAKAKSDNKPVGVTQ